MQIGNKVFPYPVLNNTDYLSGYKNTSHFELAFDTTEDGKLITNSNSIVLKNVCFKLQNDDLNKLFNNNILKCALIIECSSSLFRKITYISDIPQDIIFNIQDFKNDVSISSYMYVSKDIKAYTSVDFNDYYDGYLFDIEKYDIVAIDDGFKFRIDIESDRDNLVESIFTIIQKDSNDHQLSYSNDTNKILIYLSPEYYSYYETIKYSFTNTNWAILIIPPLAACLNEIQRSVSDGSGIEDIIDEKRWFKSICWSYEKATNSKLTIEDFLEINSLELAQLVLNSATCNGLKDFADLLINGQKDSEGGEADE